MLESISWREFIDTIAILVGGYYLIAILIGYGPGIINWLKANKSKPLVPHRTSEQNDSIPANPIMGGVIYSEEVGNAPREVINSEDLIVAQTMESEESISPSFTNSTEGKHIQIVSALYEEIKALLEMYTSIGREESKVLFQTLLTNYTQLVGSESQGAINRFIQQGLNDLGEFQIDLREINSWWPEQEDEPE